MMLFSNTTTYDFSALKGGFVPGGDDGRLGSAIRSLSKNRATQEEISCRLRFAMTKGFL